MNLSNSQRERRTDNDDDECDDFDDDVSDIYSRFVSEQQVLATCARASFRCRIPSRIPSAKHAILSEGCFVEGRVSLECVAKLYIYLFAKLRGRYLTSPC